MLRHDERIAIVGMAGILPGAQDLAGFWDNVRSALFGEESRAGQQLAQARH